MKFDSNVSALLRQRISFASWHRSQMLDKRERRLNSIEVVVTQADGLGSVNFDYRPSERDRAVNDILHRASRISRMSSTPAFWIPKSLAFFSARLSIRSAAFLIVSELSTPLAAASA